MKTTKMNDKGFGLVEILLIMLIVVITGLGGYFVYRAQQATSPSKNAASKDAASKSSSGDSSSGDSGNNSSSKLANGEELNKKGETRPSQYLQICLTSDDIQYVTQGDPKCLGDDRYQGSYSPGVPGTLFSSPCKTTDSPVRYAYISENESCPSGTKLVFYNNVCPADAVSSDECSVQ